MSTGAHSMYMNLQGLDHLEIAALSWRPGHYHDINTHHGTRSSESSHCYITLAEVALADSTEEISSSR